MKSKQPDWKQQVMGRVWASAPSLQERQTLQELMSRLRADAAFLRSIGDGALVKELEEQETVLKGIGALETGNVTAAPRPTEPTVNLKACYHHCLNRLDAWLLRSGDPQFSPVYARLAEQTRGHCYRIAWLMGEEKSRTKGSSTNSSYHRK